MKNTIQLTLAALAITGVLLLTAAAQPQLKPINNTVEQDKQPRLKKVLLPCATRGGDDVPSSLQVTNSSAQPIEKSMLIYYSFSNGAQGQSHPNADVAPGKSTILNGPPVRLNCQAWAFVL